MIEIYLYYFYVKIAILAYHDISLLDSSHNDLDNNLPNMRRKRNQVVHLSMMQSK